MAMTHGTALATAGRILVGLTATVGAAFHALLWLFVAGFQCDESCDGGSWHGTAGAWQWTALGVLGLVSFLLVVACSIAFAFRNSPRALSIGLGVAAVVTGLAPWILSTVG
jgi:hypothetical protein